MSATFNGKVTLGELNPPESYTISGEGSGAGGAAYCASKHAVKGFTDALRIEVSLPWLLAKAAKRLLPILRKEATLLLEKK